MVLPAFLVGLLPLILGAGAVVAGGIFFQDAIIALVTALFLGFMAWLFLDKSIEALVVEDTKTVGIIFLILGLSSAIFALYLINPGIFAGNVNLSFAGAEPVIAEAPSVDLLSITPLEKSPINNFSSEFQSYFNILIFIGLVFFLIELKNKNPRRRKK